MLRTAGGHLDEFARANNIACKRSESAMDGYVVGAVAILAWNNNINEAFAGKWKIFHRVDQNRSGGTVLGKK